MSSEEQFEKIENRIKQAVENNDVVFEEKSWNKMEVLLDKDDKRRPFIWLWIFVPLLLTGTWIIFGLTKKSKDELATNTIKKYSNKSTDFSKETISKNETFREKEITTQKETTTQNQTTAVNLKNTTTVLKLATPPDVLQAVGSNRRIQKRIKTILPSQRTNATLNKQTENEDIETLQTLKRVKENAKSKIAIANSVAEADETNKTIIDDTTNNKIAVQQKLVEKEPLLKKDTSLSDNKKTVAKKENKILSRFYLLGTIAADNGSVKLLSFKNSSLAAKYGIGIGYELNKKFSVQTGFYIAKKKYVAGTEDYHAKEGTYLSMITITKVDAECLVYEIPISLRYNVLQKKSFTLFTSAAIASYIMKKEDYNYFYNRYGREVSKAYDYTGNQHLFSTGIISAGIEKNITKKFSLQLEPAVSIPLSGVGEGSVKLFSTTLQLGLKYHPFKK
jgi:hypothetical protein